MSNSFNKGSVWRIWDLQVQTILDDGYVSLSEYYQDLKNEKQDQWNEFISKVGGEVNALLFDSKEYFNDVSKPEAERCTNYARNLFAFVDVFSPNLGLIGFTDHNYYHPQLMDALYKYGSKATCKCICGVEVNASGVHMLVFFENPPYSKSTFSDGIKTFLDTIKINQPKENGVLTVSNESVTSVANAIIAEGGIYIFPHCNSSNGLFQERPKTDRTYLANVFNYQPLILLQAANHDTAQITTEYIISKKSHLTSKFLFAISQDSRRLLDIGNCDNKNFYTWVKADPTFQGLKQIIIENDRVEIDDLPKLIKRVNANKTKFIKSLEVKKVEGSDIADIWFNDFLIELNSGLIAVIGNKGSGKSAVADIIGLCGNTYQDPDNFSFLTPKKFRKSRPINLATNFEGKITWEDGSEFPKNLNENPSENLPERVKYIPQNFLETVCANVDSNEFEKELKQIIYHHTPNDQRYNKSSLDELIEYKSGLVATEILKLKGQLSKLNQEIVFLENKAREDYKTSIENQIQLKRDELTAHDTIKPSLPQSVEESTKTEEVEKLNQQREQQQNKEAEIKDDRQKKSNLVVDAEELSQTTTHFNTLRSDLSKLLLETNPHIKVLAKNNIRIEDVFTFKIDTQPILTKLNEKRGSISAIDDSLDESKEGSKAFVLNELIKAIAAGQETLDKPAKEQQKYLTDLKTWTDKKEQIEGAKESEGTLNFLLGQLDYLQSRLSGELEKLYLDRREIVTALFSNKQELTNIRKELFKPVSQFIDDYKELKDRYDVKFDVSLELKSFAENFFSFVNQARIGTFSGKDEGFKKVTELTERANFDSAENFTAFAETLLDNLTHDNRSSEKPDVDILTQLKGGKQLNELYDFIFGYDYLQPIYNLKLGDKTLQELSPGERGALLLIFYLILDNDDIPLIIDQPEENLDNESVYHILVHFIKKVKEKRQIIIVTHNPNLAVVCDADQIIHMQIDKKNKNEVKFTSGAIEDLGINESVVNVLEGTLPAFSNRDSKYIKSAKH